MVNVSLTSQIVHVDQNIRDINVPREVGGTLGSAVTHDFHITAIRWNVQKPGTEQQVSLKCLGNYSGNNFANYLNINGMVSETKLLSLLIFL